MQVIKVANATTVLKYFFCNCYYPTVKITTNSNLRHPVTDFILKRNRNGQKVTPCHMPLIYPTEIQTMLPMINYQSPE